MHRLRRPGAEKAPAGSLRPCCGQARDLIPAAILAVAVTATIIASRLLPFGDATVLVRLADPTPAAALAAAAAADAVLVDIPLPGFAVLHGNASHIRASAGLATLWTGSASCAGLS